MIQNSKGTVYYGMHFYPGVAEYSEPGKQPYRVFLNEDTIRSMDPTFAGRPVFVHHVDGVDQSIDELRKEADGWVVESFYNAADGKHWVKFLVVTEKGERAIQKQGMALSNCYIPKGPFGQAGQWNGVSYTKEIKGGEYEHLAIVPNPRYEESVILTPEQFKKYNDDKLVELKRLSNENEEKRPMVLNFFKRTKVENSVDLTGLSVVLPKTGREVTITDLVAEAEAERVVNGDHMVDVGGTKMTLNELVEKHMSMCDELEKARKANAEEDEEEKKKKDKKENDDDTADKPAQVSGGNSKKNAEDQEKEKKAKEAEAKKNAEDEEEKKKKAKEDEDSKKKNDKDAAEKFRNANKDQPQMAVVTLMADQVVKGKARYGS